MRQKLPETTPRRGAAPRDENAVIWFSVIVPVYEHWHLIPSLLACLTAQTVPQQRFEVILVDNGSQTFAPPSQLPANVRLLRCETPGSYAARNEGAEHARGEWLAFTDADCLPTPIWLAKLDEARSQHASDVLIAGPVEVVSSSAKKSVWEIYDIVKGIPQERYVGRGYAATANLAVPKDVFDALSGFDSQRFSGGDAEFCRRASPRGYLLTYAKEARVEHPARTTWRDISTKARRIKGAQLKAGTLKQRTIWLLGTIAPPVRGTWHFLRSTRHPLGYRLIAVLVLIRIWMSELMEAVRLGAGRPAERR